MAYCLDVGQRLGGVVEEKVIIDMFKHLGLTDAAVKIYLYLLKESNSTASEIARITGISRPKTYEYLNRLVDKGLCLEILGSVKKYNATNPSTAFEKIQKQIKTDYEKSASFVNKLSEILLPIYLTPNKHYDPLDYIQVLRERDSIIKKFEALEKMAKKEVLSLVKLPFVMDLKGPVNPVEFASLKRNVEYKTIYSDEDMTNPLLFQAVEAFVAAGEKVRISDKFSIPFKMFVFDQKTIMLTLEDKTISGSKLTSITVEHLDLAKGLKSIFDIYWNGSISFKQYKEKLKRKE